MIDKDLKEWITNLEGLQIQMNEFGLKVSNRVEDFMIHVLNDLPKEYDATLNGLEDDQVMMMC